MLRSKLLGVASGVLAVAALGAGPAFAGEDTGSGKRTAAPDHARSICLYSGLNLDVDEPGRTQSYGQGVRAGLKGTPELPSPGIACNGRTGFLAGGGSE
jgi:hypothetical protein